MKKAVFQDGCNPVLDNMANRQYFAYRKMVPGMQPYNAEHKLDFPSFISVSRNPMLSVNLYDLFYPGASLVRMKPSSAMGRPIQHVGSGPSFY